MALMHETQPIITLIAAVGENRVIGCDNRLPWHLPADLRHFKALTLGKPIVMGRLTWESLPGLLPQRRHIVLTRDPDYHAEGCEVAHSVDEALAAAGNAPEIMVVGGSALYAAMLPLAGRMQLTRVRGHFEGDARFPEYDPAEWREVAREDHPADSRNPHPYSFLTLERVTPAPV